MFDLPIDINKNIILVIGVGGGGSNAVNHMKRIGITGVDFLVCNTDRQALEKSPVESRIQLGPQLTEGLGAGSTPEKGKQACIESLEEVTHKLEGYKMVFIAAGMGGGTGTGAAPVIAKIAKEMGLLTVGIVTTPFNFEGKKRVTQGFDGIDDLRRNVDTLIVVSNDKLRDIHGNMGISDAFKQADLILSTAAKGISEIITVPGYVNVDFADVDKVMRDSGVAIMGVATAEGEERAIRAIDEALNSPLLEENNIAGAKNILVYITYGSKKEATMDELFSITNFVQEEAGDDANLIWGNSVDDSLGDKISVTIIATGFEAFNGGVRAATATNSNPARTIIDIDADVKQASSNVYGGNEGRPNSNARVVEFDAPRNTAGHYDRYQRNHYTKQEPFVRTQEEKKVTADDDRRKKLMQEAALRRERLRQLNVKMNTPQNISDLESEPAYMRRGFQLDNVQHSSEPTISRWTIGEEAEPQIKQQSSYLHDNVD
jgi:cell division protein FtsZ